MSEATQDLIGNVLDSKAQRDAIHIAVAPAIAHERLAPGTHVSFVREGDTTRAGLQRAGMPLVGIVDPFIKGAVKEGDRFFIFLYPNTVTGLRHVWTHPAWDGAAAKALQESEKWLRDFAKQNCDQYDQELSEDDCYRRLLEMAEEGDFCFSGQPDELYNSSGQMTIWHHVEVVRGAPFVHSHKEGASFRCSC